jgi:hypothetical protein
MKKIREDVEFKNEGGFFDLFDNHIKGSYNITDDEYDYLCTNMTDVEISDFLNAVGMGNDNMRVTFSLIRRGLEIRNKYLEQYTLNS